PVQAAPAVKNAGKIEARIEVAKTDIAKPEPVKVALPSKPAPPKPTAKVLEAKVEKPAPIYESVVKVRTNTGHGSGVHIGGGKFLTAAHVTDGAKELHIRTPDGKERDAELLWSSPAYDVS